MAQRKLLFIILVILIFTSCTTNKVIDEHPDQILKQYAKAISESDCKTLVRLYGGEYEFMEGFSPKDDRSNHEKVFKNYLKILPDTIFLDEIIEKTVQNENEIMYVVTFKRTDGSLFDVGDTQNRSSQFRFALKKINGRFMVMDPPPYQA